MTAVIFPGIGYHADKPLLYYTEKLAKKAGYEVIRLEYKDVPKDALKDNLGEALKKLSAQVEEALDAERLKACGNLLFVSKSIGTVLAALYQKKHSITAWNIMFTPLEQTFQFADGLRGIVFCGAADPWSEPERIKKAAEASKLPLYLTENANHSLETGDPLRDIQTLQIIMKRVSGYLSGVSQDIYHLRVPNGEDGLIDMSAYRGKVLLIVNTATGCGFTPQYEALEKMYLSYHKEGFEILDFPCNQFGRQAPGTNEDIQNFCRMRYDTQFPQFSKTYVRGAKANPLFKFLTARQGFKGFSLTTPEAQFLHRKLLSEDPTYESSDEIKWNFTKFLVDRKGQVIARFEPTEGTEALEHQIQALLRAE